MLTNLRVLAALVTAWLATFTLMTLPPQASGMRRVHAAEQGYSGALSPQPRTPSPL
jgi:hypothetical protein